MSHRAFLAAGLAMDLAAVSRATHRPDGHAEDVAVHSLSLVLLVLAIDHPWSREAMMAFAAVHDAIETLTGDVDTSVWTPELEATKAEREAAAAITLRKRLPIRLWRIWQRYEAQDTPEARAVRILDKMLPKIVRAMGPDEHLPDRQTAERELSAQAARLKAAAPQEWEVLADLFWSTGEMLLERCKEVDNG